MIKKSFAWAFALTLMSGTLHAATTLPSCKAPGYSGNKSIRDLNDPLAVAYNSVMLVNESGGGLIAYCLSRSGMVESGLSFGVSQLDLRTNEKAWPVLEQILDANGFSKNDMEYLKTKLVGLAAPRARDVLKQTDPRLQALLVKANEALGQPSSRKIIDDIHTTHVKEMVDFMSATTAAVAGSKAGAEKLLQNSMTAKLLIMDFKNLFGSINGQLLPFLNSGTVQTAKGTLTTAEKNISVSDIIRYELHTKQGSSCAGSGRAEILRRIGYVLSISKADGDNTSWSVADNKFFRDQLPEIIKDACVSHAVDLSHLAQFAKQTFK